MALTHAELMSAVEENPEGIFGLYALNMPGAIFERASHIRRMNFGVPVAFLNGIAVAKFTADDADDEIAKAIADMKATGLPWNWHIGPTTTPSDLGERLLQHGLQLSYEMPLMTISTKDWSPSPLPEKYQNIEVLDFDTFDRWLEVGEIAFKLPHVTFEILRTATLNLGFGEDCPVRNFAGIVDGEIVCTSTIFYGSGIGGIYSVGAPADFRGKGYGGAVTEACIADAKQRGYETVFLQASKMGFPVYRRLGFEEVAREYVYAPAEA